MTFENDVHALEDGQTVGCIFCIGNGNDRQYNKGEAFLAGPGHSPFDSNANYVCRQHLDSDAVIYPKEAPALVSDR